MSKRAGFISQGVSGDWRLAAGGWRLAGTGTEALYREPGDPSLGGSG